MRQSSLFSSLALLCIVSLAVSTQAYFVILREGDQRCFAEDVPKDTLIVGSFQCTDPKNGEISANFQQELVANKQFGIQVKVQDPLDRQIYGKVHDPTSKFALTSQVGGQHYICFQTNTSAWFNPFTFRFHFEIKTGSGGVDYERVAKKEHLDGISLQVKRMNDRLVDIQNEQNYQRWREVQFRDLSEDTNEKVVYFAMFQVIVVVGSAFWQIRHLRNFFRKKKLV